jgi:mannose/cellobiose epimerase-like protein (N-acyl-D-glucosamine 2-epimerase family)
VPEHFDANWRPLPEYNRDRPADQFRPYGATIGHWFEWARLLVTLDRVLANPPGWLVEDAVALFDAAASVGWPDDAAVGIPYTVDWADRVVVDTRLHWVMCEAVLAADAVHRRTGHETAGRLVEVWWSCIGRWFVDARNGSWWHELDAQGRPTTTIWVGKPDVYHAFQAVLLPDLPLGPPLRVSR